MNVFLMLNTKGDLHEVFSVSSLESEQVMTLLNQFFSKNQLNFSESAKMSVFIKLLVSNNFSLFVTQSDKVMSDSE